MLLIALLHIYHKLAYGKWVGLWQNTLSFSFQNDDLMSSLGLDKIGIML